MCVCVCVYEKQLFCTQENKKHKIVEPGEKGKLKSESVITITYFLKSTLGCRARRRDLNRPQGFLCIEETKLRVWGSKVMEHTTQEYQGRENIIEKHPWYLYTVLSESSAEYWTVHACEENTKAIERTIKRSRQNNPLVSYRTYEVFVNNIQKEKSY